MTNYEIITSIEYIRSTMNQKFDMLINKIKQEDMYAKQNVKKSDISISSPTVNQPLKSGGTNGWIEMTGNQVEIPNMTL